MGESFQASAFTGMAEFSLPLPVTPARGFEPDITISYSSGSGNGPLGLGFSLDLPSVTRRTDTGIPAYDDTDRFTYSAIGELTPALEHVDGAWRPIERVVDNNGIPHSVVTFRPRDENDFSRIERWISLTTGESYWRVVDSSNVTSTYGKFPMSRISDPHDPLHVFEWLIDESVDANGNMISYSYIQEDGVNIPVTIYDAGRSHARRYPSTISYGNYQDSSGVRQWAFEITFDYGEYSDQPPFAPDGAWPARADRFSDYRAGFEVRTNRLCRRILMFHLLPAELGAARTPVSATVLEYDESPALTRLTSIRQIGYATYPGIDGFVSRERPPVSFRYIPFAPESGAFTPITFEGGARVPAPFQGSDVQLLDIRGEGIPGILGMSNGALLFWSPLGDGRFGGPRLLDPLPLPALAGNGDAVDLDGNGRLEWAVSGLPGSYPQNDRRQWETFRPFASAPTAWPGSDLQPIDLNGSGRIDLLRIDTRSIRVYPSLGLDGFGDPVTRLNGSDVPPTDVDDATVLVTFADTFGDGLNHRVLIADGVVRSWPNLGRGTFAEPVCLGNAPRFDGQLDPTRLFLVDIDGSGPVDLIYAHADRVDIWFNRSGNSFAGPLSITLPEPLADPSQIGFADVAGGGTTCMIFTSLGPETRHWYYDFSGEGKPYLLSETSNNCGGTTRIRYIASTRLYLEDLLAGRDWPTALPFPVQVVERIETWDDIALSLATRRYRYHDGFYDPIERVFRGFGYVESWSGEELDEPTGASLFSEKVPAADPSLRVPPAYTRSWYHTGAYYLGPTFSRHYAADYYAGDPDALMLPDSVFLDQREHGDTRTVRQAVAALAGQLLREEIYGLDGGPLEGAPYQVSEHNYQVRLLQPPAGSAPGSFLTRMREEITYDYERIPSDPRVSHAFTLTIDAFGNPELIAQIYYPRRPGASVLPEQQVPRARATNARFINITDGGTRIGLPEFEEELELGGMSTGGGSYFGFDQVATQVATALETPIPYHEPMPAGQLCARLLRRTESYYWNEDQTLPLPLGQATPRALTHHAASAVFPDAMIRSLFDDTGHAAPATLLAESGGYTLDRGYWWNPGLTAFYGGASRHYLPDYTVDPFGATTSIAYDPYFLLTVAITDPEDYVATMINDYRAMQPRAVIDINGGISEVLFDPLGEVFVSSVRGTEDGRPAGDDDLSSYIVRFPADRDALLADPALYLQGATVYYFTDTLAWTRPMPEPVGTVGVLREIHVRDLRPGASSPLQITLQYVDGLGRVAQRKQRVPTGIVPPGSRELLITTPVGDPSELWLTTGTIVHNNRGMVLRRYEPFFIDTPAFTGGAGLAPYGIADTIHYDPMLRERRVDHPTTFFTLVEYTSWLIRHFDENDTITASAYYQAHICDTDPSFADERDALLKAAPFDGTPRETALDPVGSIIRDTRIDVDVVSMTDRCNEVPPLPPVFTRTLVPLTSVMERDIDGRLVSATDPRLREAGGSVHNLERIYDMLDRVMINRSVDSGARWVLSGADGNPIRVWDARGIMVATTYDLVGRPTEVRVSGDGPDRLAEQMTYGGDPALNQRGRLILRRDESGIQSNELYSITGELLAQSRQLVAEAGATVDWSMPTAVTMDGQVYELGFAYDVPGRLTRQINADGGTIHRDYYPPGWLATMSLESGAVIESYLTEARYNARGERRSVAGGSGAAIAYEYEPETFRLASVETTRPGSATPAQSIGYTYDPVGNATRIEDRSPAGVFCDQAAAPPILDFTYDALYRLRRATGRQAPALSGQDYRVGFKQSSFLPLCQTVDPPATLDAYVETYTYDRGDNLTAIDHQSNTSWTRRLAVSATSNRAVPESMIAPGTAPDDFFDPNGNLERIEFISSMSWDYRDFLSGSGADRGTGRSTVDAYDHDANGVRTRHVVTTTESSGSVTVEEAIYIGALEITTVTTDGAVTERRRSLRLDDVATCVAIRMETTTSAGTAVEIRYQYGSELGAICLELDAEAGIISYEEYLPQGSTSTIAGADTARVRPKKHRHGGQECDDSTGLYDYGLRSYIPWIGRWSSPDPAGPIDGLNLYAFVRDNPSSATDLGGLARTKQKCATCGRRGHTSASRTHHPTTGRVRRPARVYSYAQILAKYGVVGGNGKYVRVHIGAMTATGVKVRVLVNVSGLALRYSKDMASYMLSQLSDKYAGANRLIAAGHETATIGSRVHEATSSQQFATAAWARAGRDMADIPRNPSGTVDIRAVGHALSPPPAGLLDAKGRVPTLDVDEHVSRDFGGSGSHPAGLLRPAVPGQNQWFMSSAANSLAGAVDTTVLATAKKVGFVGMDILKFSIRRVESFTS